MDIGLNREQWIEKLEKIGEHANAKICLIGSGACMLSGMQGRTSMDLDVWSEASDFDTTKFKEAVEKAGLYFNPTYEFVDKPYIQIVDPGICQTGEFKSEGKLLTTGGLNVTRPPIENLIASKLLRSNPKDLEDIAHLITNFQPDLQLVADAIVSMPAKQREMAQENMVFLEVLCEGPDM